MEILAQSVRPRFAISLRTLQHTNFVQFTYDLAGRRTKIKDPHGYEAPLTILTTGWADRSSAPAALTALRSSFLTARTLYAIWTAAARLSPTTYTVQASIT